MAASRVFSLRKREQLFLGGREDDHAHMQRFTIAHTIGHHPLHSEDTLHYYKPEVYPEEVFN